MQNFKERERLPHDCSVPLGARDGSERTALSGSL